MTRSAPTSLLTQFGGLQSSRWNQFHETISGQLMLPRAAAILIHWNQLYENTSGQQMLPSASAVLGALFWRRSTTTATSSTQLRRATGCFQGQMLPRLHAFKSRSRHGEHCACTRVKCMTLGPKLYPCQIQVSIIFPWSRNHRQNASKMHRFQRLLVICVVGYMILKCLSRLT